MRTIPTTPLLLISAGLAVAAIATAPSSTLFDNDQVKVVRALEKTHSKGGFHEHKVNRVMIYMQPGKQRFEFQDGRKPAVFEYKAGEVKWSPPEGMHSPEIIGDQPFNIVEVELKKSGTGKKIVTKLDPPKIDPKHYKIELENDQVRVIRAHIGPGESVPQHEHTLNRVTVYMTDQNMQVTNADGKVETVQHKAGDVAWSPPNKHQEKNISDKPFEVVAVEIKD